MSFSCRSLVIGSGPEANLAAQGAKAATKPTATTAGASEDATASAAAAADVEGASVAQGKSYELELADPSVPLTWVGEVDGEEVSGEGWRMLNQVWDVKRSAECSEWPGG